MPALGPPKSTLRRGRCWAVLTAVWLISGIYAAHYIDRGWVPYDEGTLGHSAERVLTGQLPHRDFDEVYTGGLSYLNAAAFKMMGTNLVTIRRVLFVFFLAWVPAVFYIAIRFASPVTAGLVALLAVAWSLPNYSAGVPSWYNLFFATFGAAALLCYLKLERRRWLFLAGACGGLSILVKIAGLYFVAAALIVLAYWEQSSSLGRGKTPVTGASDIPVRGETLSNHRAYTAFVAFAAVLLVLLLVALVQPLAGPIELIHFVLPGAAMATFLVWKEWTGRRPSSRQRFRALASLLAPFALGVAIPLALLVLPYLASGTLAELADGLFTAPRRRMSFATWRLPRLSTTIAVLPLVFVLAASPRWSPARRLRVAGLVGVLLIVLLVVSQDWRIYQTIWFAMRALVPMTVVAGVWLLARRSPGRRRSAARRQPAKGPRDESVPREGPDRNAPLDGKKLMVLLAVAGICSLVQFPFSTPIYFLYVAPLAALAGLAVVSCQAPGPRPVFVALLVFYLAFAVRWINPGFIYWMGIIYRPDTQTEVLDLERGGIRVSKEHKITYETLVALVREHGGGGYVYATPDCPEVYFLSGLSNPTRTIYDFFDDSVGRTPRILSALGEKAVQVIVLNRKPKFSGPPGHDLLDALVARFPQSTEVGRFVVRWKE